MNNTVIHPVFVYHADIAWLGERESVFVVCSAGSTLVVRVMNEKGK